jgi:hypothetical protein
MSLKKRLLKKVSVEKSIILALMILLPFLGFFLGMEYQRRVFSGLTYQEIAGTIEAPQTPSVLPKSAAPEPAPPKVEPYKLKKNCPKYGFSQEEEFLRAYRVKQGDTLLLIARSQLDDSSRYNEIIVLNSWRFPHLSVEDPYLEIGWTLYLPPMSIRSLEGRLFKINGELAEIDDNGRWRIIQPGGMGYFLPTDRTQMPEGVQFKVGDCVSILYESERGIVYSVSLQ